LIGRGTVLHDTLPYFVPYSGWSTRLRPSNKVRKHQRGYVWACRLAFSKPREVRLVFPGTVGYIVTAKFRLRFEIAKGV
jgi:hypothetical protein